MTTEEQRREVMRAEVRARRSGQGAPSEPPGAWAARAACSGRSRIFDDPAREAEALAICAACPVLNQCHGWSLHNAVEGVAGGMTSKTRKAWRKAKKIAEPVVSIDDYLAQEVVARDHLGKHNWPDAALMAIATWTRQGESADDIADRLGVTRRAVVRYRNVCRDRALIA